MRLLLAPIVALLVSGVKKSAVPVENNLQSDEKKALSIDAAYARRISPIQKVN